MKEKLIKFSKELAIYVVIVGALIYGIPKALTISLGTETPMASITSSSMWPALKKGDMVLIKAVNKEDLQVDDIVVYQNSKGFTIHRVTRLNQETITTKGDANNVFDTPVRYEQVVGKVVNVKDKPLRMPYLGMISILISKI